MKNTMVDVYDEGGHNFRPYASFFEQNEIFT